MSIIALFVVLATIGILAWAFTTFIPMPPGIKNLIVIVAVVCAVWYVLYAFGFVMPNVRVPSIR